MGIRDTSSADGGMEILSLISALLGPGLEAGAGADRFVGTREAWSRSERGREARSCGFCRLVFFPVLTALRFAGTVLA